jgi:peptide/nickel transport system substrate-binding protein
MVSALLAACAAPQAAAPTSPPTSAAAPTTAPTVAAAAKPTAAAAPTSAGAPTSAPAAAGAGSSKPRAVIGIVQEPTSLDPTADATASISTTLRDNLYEGLVRLDGNGKIVGSLAKTWDVDPTGKTVTFHLVSGAKWHDGTPFTASDVKFAWDRAANPNTDPVNPHRDYWAPVQSVEAVDDATARMTLSGYSDNWLFHMAAGSACIVSPKSAANNKTNPIGTGPFKYGNWNHGASVTLARNDDYWGTKARLNEVEFRVFGDANALTNALRAGDIDAIGQVQDLAPVPQFQQDANYQVLKGASSGKVMVSVNGSSGPLSDKRVRQALYAAIDRKAWIDGFYFGFAAPIGSHATPNDGEPYYVDMTSVNTYDPAKGRQLLEAAGVSGLKLRLAQISAFPYAVQLTDVLASQLTDIGVSLDVQPMEFPRWLQQVFSNAQDYDLTIINHVEERDIGNYANPKYYWHYDNADVAAALKSADAEPDAAKRNASYKQVLQTLADDAANLWVAAPTNLAILRKGFEGYQAPGISPSLYLGEAYFS